MLAATRKLKEWNKGKLCLATWSMLKKKEKKKKDVEYKSFFFLQGYMQHKWVHWLGLPHQSTNCCVSIHMGAMCAGLGGQTPRADKKRVQGLTWMCTSKEQSTLGCRANTSPILPFPLSLSSSRKKVGDIVTCALQVRGNDACICAAVLYFSLLYFGLILCTHLWMLFLFVFFKFPSTLSPRWV